MAIYAKYNDTQNEVKIIYTKQDGMWTTVYIGHYKHNNIWNRFFMRFNSLDGWNDCTLVDISNFDSDKVVEFVLEKGSGEEENKIYFDPAKVRDDWGDIRVTDKDNNIIPYYVKGLSKDKALCYVQSTNLDFVIHYNNPDARKEYRFTDLGIHCTDFQYRDMTILHDTIIWHCSGLYPAPAILHAWSTNCRCFDNISYYFFMAPTPLREVGNCEYHVYGIYYDHIKGESSDFIDLGVSGNDTHNWPSLDINENGILLVVWGAHGEEFFYKTLDIYNEDFIQLQEKQIKMTPADIAGTYPQIYMLESNNHFVLCCRGGYDEGEDDRRDIQFYDPDNDSWYGETHVLQTDVAGRAYGVLRKDKFGVFHIVCSDESSNPHYLYSEDDCQTWKNLSGNEVDLPAWDQATLVFDGDARIQSINVDSNNMIYVNGGASIANYGDTGFQNNVDNHVVRFKDEFAFSFDYPWPWGNYFMNKDDELFTYPVHPYGRENIRKYNYDTGDFEVITDHKLRPNDHHDYVENTHCYEGTCSDSDSNYFRSFSEYNPEFIATNQHSTVYWCREFPLNDWTDWDKNNRFVRRFNSVFGGVKGYFYGTGDYLNDNDFDTGEPIWGPSISLADRYKWVLKSKLAILDSKTECFVNFGLFNTAEIISNNTSDFVVVEVSANNQLRIKCQSEGGITTSNWINIDLDTDYFLDLIADGTDFNLYVYSDPERNNLINNESLQIPALNKLQFSFLSSDSVNVGGYMNLSINQYFLIPYTESDMTVSQWR